MGTNLELVQRGFQLLHPLLAGYVCQELNREYGAMWWQEVLRTLNDQVQDLPDDGDYATLVDSLDIANCLRLFDRKWNEIFRKKLSIDYRTWSKELMGVRNKVAHIGLQDFSDNDTWRALDTMARLCEPFDAEVAGEINDLLRESRYGSAAGSTQLVETHAETKAKPVEGIMAQPLQGLPSWRDVIQPHPDVAQGRYKNAEFAANLAQVARGEGAFEYRDPVEFFARTYVTEGMKGLLVQALKRIAGKDGEPVIQLKTAFGGGKTHSMLALYHMMRGTVPIDKIPNVKPVLQEAGVHGLPKANVAVLVGTALNPAKARRPQNMPGITINTIWGEMAAQLAESAGDLSLYDYVKDADKKGVAPGAEALTDLFNACGPCLILMDELVAYAKTLYGVLNLPAGSFDNFITFIQQITEAANASKNSMVVASIPESDIEVGGEAGQIALEAIEHTFGRMESIWKPVAANEGFEVVRRRLFLDCKDPQARDRVCNAFSQMYLNNADDFPIEAKEAEYQRRLVSCYPIHPEVFDSLYEEWATLERFQRTRGVLRFMAAVIHELWMGNDASAMIMPGSIPMDVPNVRDELTRYLDESWNAIVDKEVDGKNSIPYQKDKNNDRYGQLMASRRVARTIMLGSAPTTRGQAVRGIEASNIRLGVVQPGENISVFNDALNTLQSSLSYLYTSSNGDRFWYDTRPTLRKTVADRASRIAFSEVDYEIESRLKKLRKEWPFEGLHICPTSSLDVTDDQTVRLVLLRPNDTYQASWDENEALQTAKDILDHRGSAPRIYRNMLAFVAPDKDGMGALKEAVKEHLAWRSIKDDREYLNLDAAQDRETSNSIKRSNDTVDLRIKEAYCWLLVPYIDRELDIKTIIWERINIKGGTDSIVAKAARKMQDNESLITTWAPALLKMELDQLLWKDANEINVKKLWEDLCTYCYLPRLANYSVLEATIRRGVNEKNYFALADGKADDRYFGLSYDQYVGAVDKSAYLVKLVAALQQIEADRRVKERQEQERKQQQQTDGRTGQGGYSDSDEEGGNTGGVADQPDDKPTVTPVAPQPKNTHFFMSAKLDNTRINRDVQRLVEEVISHLTNADGVHVEIALEVTADASNEFEVPLIRTVTENCKTLKVDQYGFDE